MEEFGRNLFVLTILQAIYTRKFMKIIVFGAGI
jgi:hypothetical protein